jgi:hypothetical protein
MKPTLVIRSYGLHVLVILVPLVFAVGQCYKTDFLGMIPSKAHNNNNGYINRNGSNGKSSSAMTLRVDKEIVDKLRSEANNKGMSLNALTNQALHRYVEWNTFEQGSGMVPVSAPVLVELLNRISEEEIINIAKTVGKNTARDLTLLVKGTMDVDSFICWFLARMKNCSVITENKENVYGEIWNNNNNNRIYVLKHALGYKWSLFHKTVLESVFYEILGLPIETHISDSTLMFKITEQVQTTRRYLTVR